MKPRFKDKHLDRVYQTLKDETPEGLDKRQIWGSIADDFRQGFRGGKKKVGTPMNSLCYAAYVAGKESKKRKKK